MRSDRGKLEMILRNLIHNALKYTEHGSVTVNARTDRDRERAFGLLARRGYELELAYDAVRAFERGA